MSDELLDELTDLINSKVNIPMIGEKVERDIIRAILALAFSFLGSKLSPDKE